MTKKDYVKVAAMMKKLRKATGVYNAEGRTLVLAKDVEDGLADIFAEDNPLFDRERFIKACGQ